MEVMIIDKTNGNKGTKREGKGLNLRDFVYYFSF